MKPYPANYQMLIFTKNNKNYFVNFISIMVFIFFLSACSKAIEQEPTKPISYADIKQFSASKHYQITRQYVGKVKAKQHSSLGFEVSGKVINVLVDVGDRVNKGDQLAVLDIERLTIKHQELTANLQQIHAQKLLNTANLKRQKSLISQGYTSEQRIDELIAEKSILAANAQTVNASILSIDYQITHSELIAPFDGIISLRHISQGDVIEVGKPVVNIFTEKDHEIHLGVPAAIAKRLQIQADKQKLITVAIAGQFIETNIIAISKHVDTSTQTVRVRLVLPPHVDAFSEQLVNVFINEIIVTDGFWVPLSALTDGIRGQWNILTAIKVNQSTPTSQAQQSVNEAEQYILKKETIKVLFSNTEQAYITGLPEQNLILVASGVHRFVAKQRVVAANSMSRSKTSLQGTK